MLQSVLSFLSLGKKKVPVETRPMPTYIEGYVRTQDLQETASKIHEGLASLYQDKSTYAMMGGFALWLMGSGRHTRDIDCLVGPDFFDEIRRCLTDEAWWHQPHDQAIMMKSFFTTESGVVVKVEWLAVDGEWGPLHLEKSSVSIDETTGFVILNVTELLITKIKALYSRSKQADRSDIAFIVKNFAGRWNVQRLKEGVEKAELDKAVDFVSRRGYSLF